MKRIMATLLGIIMIGIMAAAVPMARAEEGHGPEGTIDNEGNRIVFHSGSLTAEFEGMVPKIKFYDSTGMTRVEQKVNFRALIEFADANGDGMFQSDERVMGGAIDEARWSHTNFYSLPDGSGVGIDFTLAEPLVLSSGDAGPPVVLASDSVSLIVKAYNTTKTLTVDGRSFTVGQAEIKIDIVIKDWPFQNSTNKLALQVNMKSSTDHLDIDERTGSHDFDASHEENPETAEHEFHQTDEPEEEVRFSSGLITTSTTVGFFRFVDTATVTSSGGQTQVVPVAASFKSEADHDGGERETFMKLYLAYPNFQGTLVHDPTIGLGGGFPTLYLIVGGAAVAGLVTVVAIRRRHPQVHRDSGRN